MAHLWFKSNSEGWKIRPLAGESCYVVGGEAGAQFLPPAAAPSVGDIRLLPPDAASGAPAWTLLAGRDAAALRVNGQRLLLGIRALRDRDEISVAGHQWFFSTEKLACVVAFPGLDQPACCPRCKQQIKAGSPAVACPSCGAWHHQSEEFPCWTYEPTCALCQTQSTALDAGYSWTPEML